MKVEVLGSGDVGGSQVLPFDRPLRRLSLGQAWGFGNLGDMPWKGPGCCVTTIHNLTHISSLFM